MADQRELTSSVRDAGLDRPPAGRERAGVAALLAPLLSSLLGDRLSVQLRFWDGSTFGPDDGPGSVHVHSPAMLRRMLWSPDELGLARAYVSGDIDFEGDTFAVLAELHRIATLPSARRVATVASLIKAAVRVGAVGLPLPPPDVEIRLSGARHSRRRDAAAISHHYDVGNDFYALVLGASMTYSCARFETADTTLEAAQASKHELICRKLGLHERPGARLLDVGCGWGSMVLHAARNHRVHAVGITLSAEQAAFARERVRDAGLEDLVEIRLQDYRDLGDEQFDAISSIGMFEHVGTERMAEYFSLLSSLLSPEGRLLNHAISTPGGSRMSGRTFVNRYVFPDGELVDVARVVQAMEDASLEVRDVESLREHYTTTLRAWVRNLEDQWSDAVALVGEARARVWWLYMSGSANGFADGGLALHQVLAVSPGPGGSSGMPPTRLGWT